MTTKDVIILGPGQLKTELASILQEYFSNINCITTKDLMLVQ